MNELKRLLREKEGLDRADRVTFEESLRLSEINAKIYRITKKQVEAVANPDYEKPSGVEPALQQIREHFKKIGENMNIREAVKRIGMLRPGCYHSVEYTYDVYTDGSCRQNCWGYISFPDGGYVSGKGKTWTEVIYNMEERLKSPKFSPESIEEIE